jgi:hypothetical protein
MEVTDQIIKWIIALGPTVGGVVLYLEGKRRSKKKAAESDAPLPVLEGVPVTPPTPKTFELETLQILKDRIADLEEDLDKAEEDRDKARDALRKLNQPIP